MRAIGPSLLALLLLSACDGNPFTTDPTDPGTDPGTSTFPLTGNTTSPTAGKAIQRVENRVTGAGDGHLGNGFAEGFVFDPGTSAGPEDDTFTVDNLAFDGLNVFKSGAAIDTVPNTNVSVFDAAQTVIDPDGDVVRQFTYRALYGKSRSGQTEFAIVRTGSYIPFGFGGFLYERNGSVKLPTSGQAHFAGDYAGIRDFSGSDTVPGGLEYVSGDMTVDIDFADFNDTGNDTGTNLGNGVKGYVTNRHVYDINGNDVTADIVTAMNGTEFTETELPVLVFNVGPGVMTPAGEISGGVSSTGFDGSALESGNYYAVVSGSNANEIVGIVVVESTDARDGMDSTTVRETGGFIVYN